MTLPDDVHHKIHNILQRFITAGETQVAIAVSGGGDSMALLLALYFFIQKSNLDIKLIALTVDHKLRADAALEALQVQQWCQNLKVEHHILNWQFDEVPKTAIQEKARDARYQLMGEFCVAHDIEKLFVAHNVEDNAETFLMRLKRGAGLAGLGAIAETTERVVSDEQKIQIVRPFLSLKRVELRHYLQQNEQAWIDDVSNENEKYERVQIRNFLTETEILDAGYVAQSAKRLARANDAVEFYVDDFWQKHVDFTEFGIAHVSLNAFALLPQELKLRLLACLVWAIGGQDNPPRWQKIENLLKQIEAGERQLCLGNCLIVNKQNALWFGFENRGGDKYEIMNILPNQDLLWQRRFHVRNEFDQPIYVQSLVAATEYMGQILGYFDGLKNCPKLILKSMPIILDENGLILHPHKDVVRLVKTQLKIRH